MKMSHQFNSVKFPFKIIHLVACSDRIKDRIAIIGTDDDETFYLSYVSFDLERQYKKVELTFEAKHVFINIEGREKKIIFVLGEDRFSLFELIESASRIKENTTVHLGTFFTCHTFQKRGEKSSLFIEEKVGEKKEGEKQEEGWLTFGLENKSIIIYGIRDGVECGSQQIDCLVEMKEMAEISGLQWWEEEIVVACGMKTIFFLGRGEKGWGIKRKIETKFNVSYINISQASGSLIASDDESSLHLYRLKKNTSYPVHLFPKKKKEVSIEIKKLIFLNDGKLLIVWTVRIYIL